MNGSHCCVVNDGIRTASNAKFVLDIIRNLFRRESPEIIMNGNPLTDCLMDRLACVAFASSPFAYVLLIGLNLLFSVW